MLIPNILFTIISILLLHCIQADETNAKDKTSKLSSVELIDLVLEEQLSSHGQPKPILDLNEVSFTESDVDEVKEDEEQATKDEERLKSRKVWSRWSKWSGCSVSCGDGNMVRWRMCVAGRCAPNEREEQRRHCSRAPCTEHIDDMHETTKENIQNNATKPEVQDVSAFSTNANSFWIHKPISQVSEMEGLQTRAIFKAPHRLTRLAKTYSFNFEPIFNRGPFEPFERRPRPVTLVAFRKNGFVPKRFEAVSENKPLEVAELQSPFNEVSDIWQQEPEE